MAEPSRGGGGGGQLSSETGIPRGLNRIKTRRLEPQDRPSSRAVLDSSQSPSYGASRPHLKRNQRAAAAKTRVRISSPREGRYFLSSSIHLSVHTYIGLSKKVFRL